MWNGAPYGECWFFLFLEPFHRDRSPNSVAVDIVAPSAKASFWLHAPGLNGASDNWRRNSAVELNDQNDAHKPAAVSDRTLRGIVEQGFFGSPGSLADARSACAELIFARAMIEAQTARIVQLDSAALKS
jgi:hypothetical protein